MGRPLSLEFLLSADRLEQLPSSPAEIAVAGRSNVGKSSLLNALGNRKNLAHTSKTPGRTRQLNCYSVDGTATAVDLPGYGFAKAPEKMRRRWQSMIEGYLLEREALVQVVVLVDGAIGPTELDVTMIDWLQASGLPYAVVATKADKVKSSQRDARRRDLAAGCGLEMRDVVWVSARTGAGIDRLRDLVRHWLSLE